MRKFRIFVLALGAAAIFTLSSSPTALAGAMRAAWQDKKAALTKVMNIPSSKFEHDLGPDCDDLEATL